MDRLTEKAPGCFGYALKNHMAEPVEFGTYDAYFDYSEAVQRLGEYEDTGLEPEDVRRLQKEWTSLIMTIDEMGGMPHLHEISAAEQEGRLVVLPKESNCYDCPMLCGHCGGCLITGYPERPDKCHDIIRKKAEAALAGEGGDEG